MDGFEVRISYVGVDLGSGYVAVAEEALYASEIGAVHK